MVSATFTAVDGAIVRIGGEGLVVEQARATMFGIFEDGSGRYEITVGDLGLGEAQGRGEGVELTEEYGLLGGGTLRVGHAVTTDSVTKLDMTSVLGVWLGDRYSAHLWLSDQVSKEALTVRLLALFSMLEFTETSTGVIVESRAPTELGLVREGAQAPAVARFVEGLGLIEAFERTPAQRWHIPTNRGAPVAGGELWVQGHRSIEEDGESSITFLLVSESAVARIQTLTTDAPEELLVDRCSRLTVSWSSGDGLP